MSGHAMTTVGYSRLEETKSGLNRMRNGPWPNTVDLGAIESFRSKRGMFHREPPAAWNSG